MRIALYSALYGSRDRLNPNCFGTWQGVDRFVFTDDPSLDVPGATIVHDPLVGLDPNRASRRCKLMPHRYFSDYDWSIYLDNNANLTGDPVALITQLEEARAAGGPAFWSFSHPERNCVYAEAESCIRARRDAPDRIRAQMRAYRTDGYPADNGLVAGTVLVRYHASDAVAALGERWFEQVLIHSRRDQLSFDYVAWKLGISRGALPGELRENPNFQWPALSASARQSDKVQDEPWSRDWARAKLSDLKRRIGGS